MPILVSNSENDGPGLIAVDIRNEKDKRELYISDIPTDDNTLIIRLQNVHTKPIHLDKTKGIEVIFPKGLFDDTTKLNRQNCQITKWNINKGESFINTGTIEESVTTKVKQFQRLKFRTIEAVENKTKEPTLEFQDTMDKDIKNSVNTYIQESLKLKRKINGLFENYLKNNASSQLLGQLNPVADLHNGLVALSEKIEDNILILVKFKADFQKHRNFISTYISETVKNVINEQLQSISGKSLFEDPDNPNNALAALPQLANLLNDLKVHRNLANLMSEHQKEDKKFHIQTTFDNQQQKIHITSEDAATLALQPNDYLVLEIKDFDIADTANTKQSNNIEVRYDNAKAVDSDFKNKFSQNTPVDIIKNVGKLLPIYAELAYGNQLINDGATVNNLEIYITNIGLEVLKIPISSISMFINIQSEKGYHPKAFVEKKKSITATISSKGIDAKYSEQIDTQTKNTNIIWKDNTVIQLGSYEKITLKIKDIVTALPSSEAVPVMVKIKGVENHRDTSHIVNVKRDILDTITWQMLFTDFKQIPSTYEYHYKTTVFVHTYDNPVCDIKGQIPASVNIKKGEKYWETIVKTTQPDRLNNTLFSITFDKKGHKVTPDIDYKSSPFIVFYDTATKGVKITSYKPEKLVSPYGIKLYIFGEASDFSSNEVSMLIATGNTYPDESNTFTNFDWKSNTRENQVKKVLYQWQWTTDVLLKNYLNISLPTVNNSRQYKAILEIQVSETLTYKYELYVNL